MSILKNPFLEHVGRGPYELQTLLLKLPRDFSPDGPLTNETYLVAEAISQHSNNSISILLSGLDALGCLLFSASSSKECFPEKATFAALGELISYISVEVESLHDLEFKTTQATKNHEAKKEGQT